MGHKISYRTLLLLCVLTLGAFLVALPAAATRLAQSSPDATPEIVEVFPSPNVPPLTQLMRTQAISIALAHPMVQEIVAGRTYTTTTYLWHASDNTVIGAGITLDITPPGTFEMDWFHPQADTDGHPVYPVETDHYKTIDTSDFLLLVDLTSDQVAQIAPGLTGTVDYLGTPRTPLSNE